MKLVGSSPTGENGTGPEIVDAERPIGHIISLPGDTGPKGDPGPKGDKGDGLRIDLVVADYSELPTESPGESGFTAFNQADGRLYVWSGSSWPVDGGGALIRGAKGDKGETGAPGEPGARGEKGEKGDRGDTGSKGDKGDQGIPGLQGQQGIQGLQGQAGVSLDIEGSVNTYADLAALTPQRGQAWINKADGLLYFYDNGFPASGQGVPFRGPQGIQGVQGVKGDQGAQGIQGPPGTTSWTALTDRPSTFPPSTHNHAIADITGLQSALPVQITQAAYDALGAGRPSRLYAIVG